MEEIVREFFVWVGWRMYLLNKGFFITILLVSIACAAISIAFILIYFTEKDKRLKNKSGLIKIMLALASVFLGIFFVLLTSITYYFDICPFINPSSKPSIFSSCTMAPYNWRITVHKAEKIILQNPSYADIEKLIKEAKENENCQKLDGVLFNLQRLEAIKKEERRLKMKLDDFNKSYALFKKELEEYCLKYFNLKKE